MPLVFAGHLKQQSQLLSSLDDVLIVHPFWTAMVVGLSRRRGWGLRVPEVQPFKTQSLFLHAIQAIQGLITGKETQKEGQNSGHFMLSPGELQTYAWATCWEASGRSRGAERCRGHSTVAIMHAASNLGGAVSNSEDSLEIVVKDWYIYIYIYICIDICIHIYIYDKLYDDMKFTIHACCIAAVYLY